MLATIRALALAVVLAVCRADNFTNSTGPTSNPTAGLTGNPTAGPTSNPSADPTASPATVAPSAGVVEGEFMCSKSLSHSDFETKACSTYCIIAKYKNHFACQFGSMCYDMCTSAGCAELAEDGTLLNDFKGDLNNVADGEIEIYTCNDDSFAGEHREFLASNMDAKMLESKGCNYYDSDSVQGGEELQQCHMLPEYSSVDANDIDWHVKHMVPLMCTLLGLILIGAGASGYRCRRKGQCCWRSRDCAAHGGDCGGGRDRTKSMASQGSSYNDASLEKGGELSLSSPSPPASSLEQAEMHDEL